MLDIIKVELQTSFLSLTYYFLPLRVGGYHMSGAAKLPFEQRGQHAQRKSANLSLN
jgi:hypothetical protein